MFQDLPINLPISPSNKFRRGNEAKASRMTVGKKKKKEKKEEEEEGAETKVKEQYGGEGECSI